MPLNSEIEANVIHTNGELFLIAQPEIYRRNPFHILGLPIVAGASDLSKRKRVLEISIKTGADVPFNYKTSILPDPDWDEISIEKPFEDLRNPYTRLNK